MTLKHYTTIIKVKINKQIENFIKNIYIAPQEDFVFN